MTVFCDVLMQDCDPALRQRQPDAQDAARRVEGSGDETIG